MYQLNPLLESTVARRLLDSGKLSPKDIMRLRRAHMIPTKKQTIAGINKGTDNMLRKMGAKVHSIEDPFASYVRHSNGLTQVHIPNATSRITIHQKQQYSPAQIAVIRRHEAREAARDKKGFDTYVNRMKKLGVTHTGPLDDALYAAERSLGHNTGVLSDEGKLLKRLQRRYGIRTFDKDNKAILAVHKDLKQPDDFLRHRGYKPYSVSFTRDEGNGLYGLSARDEFRIKDKVSRIIKSNPEEYRDMNKVTNLLKSTISDFRKKRGLPEIKREFL